jgi:hypothetical protein
MDFLIGILLVAVLILIAYNFTSISLSNSPNNGTCNNQNYLISSMQQSLLQPSNSIGGMNIPQPVVANSPISGNGSLSNQPVYDYHKYFFIA